MTSIETFLFEISKLFLTPVLVVLTAMFLLSVFYLGMLIVEYAQRVFGRRNGTLSRYAEAHPAASQEALELHLLKTIEPLRITSRVAPMLGLVATMIPMGPALVAVSSGNTQGIAANLVVAFSAVIVALLAAAITFTVLSIRRRWLLEELDRILTSRQQPMPAASANGIVVQPHFGGVAHG
jgi:biopolymer transport protein ExbB/TolQ